MENDPENDDLEGSLLAPCEEPPGEVENLIEDSVYHSPPSGNSQTIVEVIQETGKPSAKVCVSAEQSRPVISSIDENKSLQTGANGSATGTEQEPNATGGKTGLSQTPIEPNEGNKTDVNASDPNGNENLRRPELLLIEEADFSKVTGNVSNLIERDDVSIDIVTNSTQKGVSVPPEVPDSNPSSTQPQNGDSASPPFAKPENDAAIGPTLTTAQKEGLRNPFDSTYNIEQRKSRTSFFTPDLLPPNILNSYRSLSRKERDLFRVVYGYGLSNEAIVDYVELAKKHLQMLKDRKVTSLPVSPVAGGISVPLQHLHIAFESKYLTSDVAKLYLNFDCHLQAKFRKLFFMGVPEDEIIAIVKDPNVYLDKLESLRPKSSQRPRPEKNDVSNALGSRREEVTGVPKASSSNQLRAPCNPTKPPELYHSNFNPQRMIPRRFLGAYLKLKKSMKTKFRVLMYNKVPVSKILTTIRNSEDYKSLLETLEASRTVDPTPKLGIKRKKSDDDTISQPKSPTVPTKNNGPPPGYHENFDPPSVLRTRYLNIYLGMSSTQQKRFRTLFYHKMPVYKIINSVGTNSAFKTSLRTQLLQNRNNSTKSDLFDLNKLTDRQASYYINLGKGERKKYRHMFNQGYSHQEIHDGINDQELYFQMFSRQKMPANLERSPSPAESSNHRSFLDTCGKQLPETSTAHSTNVDSAFIETLAKTRYLVNQMKTPLVKSGPFSVQPSAYPQRYQDNFKSQANQPGPSSAVDPPVREIMEPRLFAVPKTKPSHVGNANPIMAMKRHVDSNYPSACLAPPKIPRKTAAPMPTTRELEKMEKSRIVYVSHALHPRELLTIAEMEEVQQRILDFILELDDGLKPSFVHANLNRQSGQLEFHCKDDNTVNWLRSFIPTWKPWTGAHLKAVVASTEGIRYKAFAILPKCMEDGDSKILQYVGKQNTKLNVMKWSVLKTDANPNGTVTMDLLIDEESAQVLSENPQINFKLGGAKIKVLMDDSVNERTLTKGQDWTRKPTRSPLQGVGISGGEISVAAKEPRQPVQFRTPTWDQRRDVVYGDAPPSWYNPKRSDYNDSVSYRKFSPAGPSSNQQLHSSIEPLPSRDSAPLYDQGYGLRQPPSPNVVRDGSLPIHEGVEKPINQSRHFSQHKAGSSQVPKKSFTEKSQSSVFKRLSYQEDLGNNQRFRDDPYPSHSRSERSSDFMGDSQQHFRRSRERSPVPVSNYEERSHMWDSGRSQSPLTRGDSHHCSVWERERSPASSSRRELDKKQSFRDDRYSSHSRSDLERSPDFRGRERSPVRISKYEERRSMWDDEQPPVPRSDPHQQYSKRDRERSPVPKRDFQQRRSERDDEPYIDRRSDNQMLARSVYELPHRDFDELPYSRSSDLYASERSASPRDSFDDPQLTPRWFQERSPEPRAVPQPKSRRDTSQPTEGSTDYLDYNFSRNNTERYSRYDDSSKSDVRNSFQPVKKLSGAGQRRLSYFIQCGLPFNIAQTLAKKPINKPPGKSLSPGKLKRMYDMMTSVEQFEYIKCLADGMNIEEAMMKVSRPGRLSSARPSYPH